MAKLNPKEHIIQEKLLKWYKNNKRVLPWRKLQKNNLPNPYFIFVSEFMLQQTTVNTVIKRFKEFINLWPNIKKLSSTSENKILSFWSGLGYYNRAKNLFKSSKIINSKYNKRIPKEYDILIKLPGIGDYTAKAILGIGYNIPYMPVDANIERILARLYGLKETRGKLKNKIYLLAQKFISNKNSTNLIQSFMDYGSIICKPRNPNCRNCIIKLYCVSYKKNLQEIIPFKSKKRFKKIKKYSRAYIFYNEKKEILVRKRSSTGMLASMLEVPNDKWVTDKKSLVVDDIALEVKDKLQSKGLVDYSFSHFDLSIEVFFTKVKKNIFVNQKWIRKNNINTSGLPTVMKKIVEVAL
tara:strand:- start:166 stop:1224 length:1059 start_codon:yes stop_codon:yes gene_type:complete